MFARRLILLVLAAACLGAYTPPAQAQTRQAAAVTARDYGHAVATAWFDLILELIRQTPGFSPPVASRALGYAGVTLYEAIVPGIAAAVSLAGQLNELERLPQVEPDVEYHWPSVANAALAGITRRLFAGGGVAQRAAIDGLESNLRKRLADQAPPEIIHRSIRHGRLVAAAVFAWSRTDGGHEAYFFNTPLDYASPVGDGLWSPTGPGYLRSLQPYWGKTAPFCWPTATSARHRRHPAIPQIPARPSTRRRWRSTTPCAP
jgi:hypothetical protein